jgi:hypothetical protein
VRNEVRTQTPKESALSERRGYKGMMKDSNNNTDKPREEGRKRDGSSQENDDKMMMNQMMMMMMKMRTRLKADISHSVSILSQM